MATQTDDWSSVRTRWSKLPARKPGEDVLEKSAIGGPRFGRAAFNYDVGRPGHVATASTSARSMFALSRDRGRIVFTLISLALLASCTATRDYFAITIARYPERDGVKERGQLFVGSWNAGKLDMEHSERLLRAGFSEYALPVSSAELVRIIEWVRAPRSLRCADGSVFQHGRRRSHWPIRVINVYPENADLVVTTYGTAPGPAKLYYFLKNGSDFVCTRSEDGDVWVTE